MSGEQRVPRAPEGAGTAGRRLWRAVLGVYDLQDHEVELLRQAVATADRIVELDELVKVEGAMVPGSQGQSRLHPAIVEARQQRLAMARLMVSLRLPDVVEDEGGATSGVDRDEDRPQRRGGSRGTYPLRPVG